MSVWKISVIALASSILTAIPVAVWIGSKDVPAPAGQRQVQKALDETSRGISAAYARGDIDAVMAYHHPDIVKALSYSRMLVGRGAVAADGARSLKANRTEFVQHDVESLLVVGDVSIQQTLFAVRRTPRGGGEPLLFRARALTVYVRDPRSPSGWSMIRAIVQPAVE